VEVVHDRLQELGRGEGRVEDDRRGRALGQLAHEVARGGGLARPHLARDQDEAAALAPSELEVREGLAVPPRQIEVLRVGGEVEGLLGEAVVGLVHF
jgi:hypothetical protein